MTGSTRRAESSWEHFSHGSDVGVRGLGPTREAAFEQAALALTGVITDPSGVEARERACFSAEAPDSEVLLYEWLNALVARMAVDGVLFGRFRVELVDGRLEAVAWGEPVDRARHRPAVEVKCATFTELAVRREEGGWVAQCVVDV
jgi:tRNA nucleotidyltransferase (CCA-adding enzyme)